VNDTVNDILQWFARVLRFILFLPEQASTFARRADGLHLFIFVATAVAAVAIGGTGLYFLIRYRRRSDSELTPHVEAPVWLEGLFVGVPLSLFLLWFFIGFRDYVWANEPPRGAMDVYVMGKQWMWKFSYPEGPGLVDVLRVPAGRPVRLLITSRDVIHSFYIPEFRLKKDAVPGRYTELWFEAPEPGEHLVMCAEYCGRDHSHMRARVVVMEPGEFEAWQAQEQEAVPQAVGGSGEPRGGDLVSQGQRVAAQEGCLKCHSVNGDAHIGPTWLGLYGRHERLESGAEVVADEAYLTESMMMPEAKVVAGFQPVMPSYFGRLSAPQVGALLEYIKSLRPERPGRVKTKEPEYVPAPR
jgi:cytochrome c oxidase subunit II